MDTKEFELSPEYKMYIKSEPWKVIAKLTKIRAGFMCEVCGAMGSKLGGNATLQVHHKTYKNFGQEDMDDLVCLCVNCHKRVHNGRLRL